MLFLLGMAQLSMAQLSMAQLGMAQLGMAQLIDHYKAPAAVWSNTPSLRCAVTLDVCSTAWPAVPLG